MAWTTPLTFASNAVLTASQLNTHLRDNLLETAPAKATTAGQIFVATGANAIAARTIQSARNDAQDTTTNTAFGDLSTSVGPSVTVTTGAQALVVVSARLSCSGSSNFAYAGFDVTGATTRLADSAETVSTRQAGGSGEFIGASRVVYVTGLTPGSNVFTMRYRVSGPSTGTFELRNIIVIPL
jgi:hypothetical protein